MTLKDVNEFHVAVYMIFIFYFLCVVYCLLPLDISVAKFAFPLFSRYHKRRPNAICCKKKKKKTPSGGSWKTRKRNLQMAHATSYNVKVYFSCTNSLIIGLVMVF